MMIYHKNCILAGLAITCLCLIAATNPARSEPPPSDPLAYVDENSITVAAFKAEMARRVTRMTTLEQKQALLEEMVHFELIYAAALKLGYGKDPQILARFKRSMVNKYREDVIVPRFSELRVSD